MIFHIICFDNEFHLQWSWSKESSDNIYTQMQHEQRARAESKIKKTRLYSLQKQQSTINKKGGAFFTKDSDKYSNHNSQIITKFKKKFLKHELSQWIRRMTHKVWEVSKPVEKPTFISWLLTQHETIFVLVFYLCFYVQYFVPAVVVFKVLYK